MEQQRMKKSFEFYNHCMKTRPGLLSALFLVLFCSASVQAQVGLSKVAQSTMNFLLVSTSPKASGMGEAYSTLGRGVEAVFYNPAGLSAISSQFDASVDITNWIADIKYFAAKAAYNLGNYGVVGVHLLTVDYGQITGTRLLYDYERSLYPKGYKETGMVNNVAAYSCGITYAQYINTQFSIGGTVKVAGQNLGETMMAAGMKENNAMKLVFDAGVQYHTGLKWFTFGMMIRNFASNIKREEIDEQLPLLFVLGGSINVMDIVLPDHGRDTDLLFALDFLHHNNYSERVNLGLEYRLLDGLSIRGGYQTNRDLASWSVGAGFRTTVEDYGIEVDYSFSQFDVFSDVNRLSLGFSF
jgi:hypothetical protein